MVQESNQSPSSRIPNFFKLSVADRIQALNKHDLLADGDLRALEAGSHTLRVHTADGMIENVVGVLGLPFSLALNFLINGKDYVVPLSVEEPSVVAGLSSAAKVARNGGGFTAQCSEPILTGQVQVVNVPDVADAQQKLIEKRQVILDLANSFHPKMVARGGGARDIEVVVHTEEGLTQPMLILHLHVDTRDAMGANIVNGMCEGVASLIASITGGQVFLRILSNLTDRSVVIAETKIPVEKLGIRKFDGKAVRDGIVLASEFARVDPYRATTHNKGIMNGIDAVAIATGNDFRALEAAAHAFAARDGRYRGLSQWSVDSAGNLAGRIEIPIKVGTVGGALETNPTVRISHRLLGSPSASELGMIMASVGLAQNFAALRALATAGIQQNHMTLHARSVATTARVPPDMFDEVVDALIDEGTIKVWKAEELMQQLKTKQGVLAHANPRSSANGKVILFGEHAVVYGRPAFAVPLPLAVEATVVDSPASTLVVPRWGVEQRIPRSFENPQGIVRVLTTVLEQLNLHEHKFTVEVFPNIPKAVGLGVSAAISVAVIRALSQHFNLELDNETVNELAYDCERSAHGNPSGVDNTLATYGVPLIFQRNETTSKPVFTQITPGAPFHILVGVTGKESLTASMVSMVQQGREKNSQEYEQIFDGIEKVTRSGLEAFQGGDIQSLGEFTNLCHGYLNALQLSTPEIEELVYMMRENGAVGAKLTGAGGGGSVIGIYQETPDAALEVIQNAGYTGFSFLVE